MWRERDNGHWNERRRAKEGEFCSGVGPLGVHLVDAGIVRCLRLRLELELRLAYRLCGIWTG